MKATRLSMHFIRAHKSDGPSNAACWPSSDPLEHMQQKHIYTPRRMATKQNEQDVSPQSLGAWDLGFRFCSRGPVLLEPGSFQ